MLEDTRVWYSPFSFHAYQFALTLNEQARFSIQYLLHSIDAYLWFESFVAEDLGISYIPCRILERKEFQNYLIIT